MNETAKKTNRKWIIAVLIIVCAGLVGVWIWRVAASRLPKGIASGNGRIESELVDISAKDPLRVDSIFVDEGDLVKPGQVLVKLNTETLNAQLAEANANVRSVQEEVAIAEASIQSAKSEIELARTEAKRSKKLVTAGAGSQREYDVRKSKVGTTSASLAEAEARLEAAKKQVDVALANAATIQSKINDATLISPVIGRVLYRLTQPGEVLGAGGKALTLVDLTDVYMEIFLPSNQAASLKIGSPARIIMDYLPDWAVPATVSFISPQAQFTPKQVETKSEREMLMFRVKLQIPNELVMQYIDQIKTGVRGVGYVMIDETVEWPKKLRRLLTVDQAKRFPAGKS